MLRALIYTIYKSFLLQIGKGGKVYYKGEYKSFLSILSDLLSWFWIEKSFNANYLVFGLNIKGHKASDFIGHMEILRFNVKVSQYLKREADYILYNYDVITKDKFISESFFKANNIPVVQSDAIIKNRILIWSTGSIGQIGDLCTFAGYFFIKNTVIEASEGLYCCRVINNLTIEVDGVNKNIESFESLFERGIWVVQKKIDAHSTIQKINSSALNTLRIVTILENGLPKYLTGFQSFATDGAKTDTWGHGAIYVGFDKELSSLRKEGYYHPNFGEQTIVNEHPDNNMEFGGYEIPYLKEAIELCEKAHMYLYFNFLIGWDVAITENGPIILEANEKPGMNAVQCISGGLKKEIIKCFKSNQEI